MSREVQAEPAAAAAAGPKGRRRRILWRLFIALLLLQVGLPLVLLILRNSVLFMPSARPANHEGLAALRGLTAEVIEVTRPDGRMLTGLDARPEGAGSAPVVLFFHGNAGNVAYRASWLDVFVRRLDCRVVLASYSGYGGNDGSPSEQEINVDALAYFDHLTEVQGVDPRQIVIYGESIGGAPALYVASERNCAGVIVQSTFASLSSIARSKIPWLPLLPTLVRGHFPTAERAAALEEPLLIVHGTRDWTVPYSQSDVLRAAAPDAEFIRLDGVGHNDVFARGGDEYVAQVARRVREWTGSR